MLEQIRRTMDREEIASWLATAIGLVWLCIFPLWQGGSYSHITLDKWNGMLILTGVTVLLGAAAILLTPKRRLRMDPRLLMAATAFLIWQTISALQSPYINTLNSQNRVVVWWGSRRYEGMVTFACYVGIFVLSSLVRPKLKWLVRGASVTLLIYAFIVALQYTGINVLNLFPTGTSIYRNYEFQGTIGNIDMVSGYTVLVTGLLLGYWLRAEKPDVLPLVGGSFGVLLLLCMEVSAGLVALAFGALLLAWTVLRHPETRVRAAMLLSCVLLCVMLRALLVLPWLDGGSVKKVHFALSIKALFALAAALGMTWLARWLNQHELPALAAKKAAILLVGLVLVALIVFALLPLSEGGGLWEIQQVLRGNIEDSYGNWRIGVWRHTLKLAQDHLLFGTGRDTFWYAFNTSWRAQESALRAAGKLGANATLENFDSPHNEYLSYLSNDGLPALLFYLALLLGTLWLGRKAAQQGREGEMALPVAVALFAVQGFFSFSICLVSPMFWCVLGLTAGLTGRKDSAVELKRTDDNERESI